MTRTLNSAFADIRAGLQRRRVWMALASEDIGDQHRRTALGPIWLVVNYLLFAGTFIFIFKRGAGVPHYEAHVATGLLVWFYVSETLSLSVSLFVREENFIKGTTLPLSVYVMRLAMQALIRALYALAGCIIILAASGSAFSLGWGWALIGVAIILLTTPAAIIVFAFLGAYFPDSQFLVANLMRVGMFLTPIFWGYDGSGGLREIFYYWNPFTYFIEIVRIPIISGELPVYSMIICGIIAVLLWMLALSLLGRLRKQVVFVL